MYLTLQAYFKDPFQIIASADPFFPCCTLLTSTLFARSLVYVCYALLAPTGYIWKCSNIHTASLGLTNTTANTKKHCLLVLLYLYFIVLTLLLVFIVLSICAATLSPSIFVLYTVYMAVHDLCNVAPGHWKKSISVYYTLARMTTQI